MHNEAQAFPRVLLFDIDGTLLSADGAGRRALASAFREVCGRSDAIDGVDFRGMTDALVVERALAEQGWSEPGAIDAVYRAYLAHLERELSACTTARALPGVRWLLETLAAERGPLAIGLGTGNIEPAAFMKLDKVGLGGFFAFGGFGSDHRQRSEILRIGALRGCRRLGCESEACQVVVIGDTFHDVDAALAIGARAIGVGTSGQSPAALRERGAAQAFATLQDPSALAALLE